MFISFSRFKISKKLNKCTLPTDSRVLQKAKVSQHRDNVSTTLKESQRWKEHTDPRLTGKVSAVIPNAVLLPRILPIASIVSGS